jgi:anaerobic selenocysteine-containing dehydrogenase
LKPDLLNAEFVIFFGTGAFEANFGSTVMAEKVTKSLRERTFKFAVVDPRLSKTASKAEYWIPIKPGADGALALGMMRWMIENNAFDKTFLENPNKEAAANDGEKSWTNATHLVRIVGGRPEKFLKLGGTMIEGEEPMMRQMMDTMEPEEQEKMMEKMNAKMMEDMDLSDIDQHVVLVNGVPCPKEFAMNADLEGSIEIENTRYETAFSLLKKRVMEKSIREYADICGINEEQIIQLAQEFVIHGKKSVAEFYRGPVQHTNGYYTAQALIMLNLLVGNVDWKGGLCKGGGHWHEFGGKKGTPYNFKEMNPGFIKAFGVRQTREKATYDKTTLFKRDNFPAKRPWFPYSSNVYQESIPSAEDQYPYPVKILYLHKGTPTLACPAGHKQIQILQDTEKIPLFIASDIVVGETTMYADYVIPDITYMERWGTPHVTPDVLSTTSKVRQPMVAPLTEIVNVAGEEMPISMEAFMIAIAKKVGLPGYGTNGFGEGMDFNRPEDFHLKAIANIAVSEELAFIAQRPAPGSFEDITEYEGKPVPDATNEEIDIFKKARAHLPKSVIDEAKCAAAAGQPCWSKTVHVLNRGGRFEEFDGGWKKEYAGHPLKKEINMYIETVGNTKDSMTGEYWDGLPKYEPIKDIMGKEINDDDYEFTLITYKEIFHGHSRTIGCQWLNELLYFEGSDKPHHYNVYNKENQIWINKSDAERLGLHTGNLVKIVSKTTPEGTFDLGNGEKQTISGKVLVREGIRPGVVAIAWHYGHWAHYGAKAEIDGEHLGSDKLRGARGVGIAPNPLMRIDENLKNVCLQDPIGASSSFFDTKVNIIKI